MAVASVPRSEIEVVVLCLFLEFWPLHRLEVAHHMRLLLHVFRCVSPLVDRWRQLTVRLGLAHHFVGSEPLVCHSAHLEHLQELSMPLTKILMLFFFCRHFCLPDSIVALKFTFELSLLFLQLGKLLLVFSSLFEFLCFSGFSWLLHALKVLLAPFVQDSSFLCRLLVFQVVRLPFALVFAYFTALFFIMLFVRLRSVLKPSLHTEVMT